MSEKKSFAQLHQAEIDRQNRQTEFRDVVLSGLNDKDGYLLVRFADQELAECISFFAAEICRRHKISEAISAPKP